MRNMITSNSQSMWTEKSLSRTDAIQEIAEWAGRDRARLKFVKRMKHWFGSPFDISLILREASRCGVLKDKVELRKQRAAD